MSTKSHRCEQNNGSAAGFHDYSDDDDGSGGGVAIMFAYAWRFASVNTVATLAAMPSQLLMTIGAAAAAAAACCCHFLLLR